MVTLIVEITRDTSRFIFFLSLTYEKIMLNIFVALSINQ
jgi:hypothetical protein